MRQFFLSFALLLCVVASTQPGPRPRFPKINDDLSVTFSAWPGGHEWQPWRKSLHEFVQMLFK